MPLRSALGLAAQSSVLPGLEKALAGLKSSASPPATKPGIQLPADHYAHPGAPTEWWWNIGTLTSGARTFGFEINAVSYAGQGGFAFTQIMLTDVDNDRHLQRTTNYLAGVFNCEDWAQHDPTKPWFVALGDPANFLSTITVTNAGSNYTSPPTVVISGGGGSKAVATANLDTHGGVASIDLWNAGSGYTSAPTITLGGGGGSAAAAIALQSYATMNSSGSDPTQNMSVKALLVDAATQAPVLFDLTLSQKGPPFLVLGSGMVPVPKTCGTALQTNNFYYSLTQLQASGTITLDGQKLPVTGVTWMDHEYGAFAAAGKPVKWILQDMQLDNGVCVSNFSLDEPVEGQPTTSIATLQYPGKPTIWVSTTTTPGKPWTSPITHKTYFLELVVAMKKTVPWWPDATLTVTSSIASQEFPAAGAIYEGVAVVRGTFNGQQVTGPAWNEQTAR